MKKRKFSKGNELESEIEQLLIQNNIVYIREGQQVSRGHKTGKGKYDFELQNLKVAIEAKEIDFLRKMAIPGINPKTRKPYVNPMIKTHQLRRLREFIKLSGQGYLLIKETSTKRYFALTMEDFDGLLIENPRLRSLKDIDKFEIKLSEFIGGLK